MKKIECDGIIVFFVLLLIQGNQQKREILQVCLVDEFHLITGVGANRR